MKLVNASAARKATAAKRINYYNDKQTQDLFDRIKTRANHPERFILFPLNIVRKITDKRAMVYRAAPVRTFDGWDQAAGEALYAAINANVTLKKANRLTRLLKTTTLRVGWSDDRPTLAVVTPNILDAIAVDPDRPTRIVVTHPGEKSTLTEYSDWTADSYTRRDFVGRPMRRRDNPNDENPYGVIPFVPCFDRSPDDEFFLPGGDDLMQAQVAINHAMVLLWRALEFESNGVAWLQGAGDSIVGGLPSADPSTLLNLPAGASFNFTSPKTPVDQVLAAVDFVIRQTAIANDLTADVFREESRAESGAAREVANRDLMEARADDIELWRGYETRLFDVLKAVVNTHAPGTIPETATVSVDFGEVSHLTESARLDGYQRRIDLGLWSPVDALMADNPDLRDRAEALRLLAVRREESAILGVGFTGPAFGSEPQ
ncbi:MAG: hypothetical protein ACPGO3_05485 [Magnetospiraceae bacterium]